MDVSLLQCANYYSPRASLFLAYVILLPMTLLLPALCFWLAARCRRRASGADEDEDLGQLLALEQRPGATIVLRGWPEPLAGKKDAAWADRVLQGEPFTLRHASGRRFRVEPGQRLAALDRQEMRRLLQGRIYLRAQIEHWPAPQATDHYRGSSHIVVLMPEGTETLELLKYGPAGPREWLRRRSRYYLGVGCGTLALLAIVQLMLLDFHASRLFGWTVVEQKVTHTFRRSTIHVGWTGPSCETEEGFASYRAGRLMSVPVVLANHGGRVNVGTQPALHRGYLAAVLVLLIAYGLLLSYGFVGRRFVPE